MRAAQAGALGLLRRRRRRRVFVVASAPLASSLASRLLR